MKNLKRKYLLVVLLAAVALTAGVIGSNFLSTQNDVKPEKPEKSQLNTPRREEHEFEGDAEERRNWFWDQRTYGVEAIPPEARQQAKEEADQVAPPIAERSFGDNSNWSSIGPQPVVSYFPAAYGDASGRINSIAVHPTDPNIVLIGSATGGVWRSTNALADANGANPPAFSPVTDSQVDLAVGSIAFAASNPNKVYAGMGDRDNGYFGTGILRSGDAGASWTRVDTTGLPAQGLTTKIGVAQNNENTVYLARSEYRRLVQRNYPGTVAIGGFYLSTDGGASWTRTLNGNVMDFAVNPANSNIIYATALTSTQAGNVGIGIYKSINGGQSFVNISAALNLNGFADLRVATSAAAPNKIYAYGGSAALDGQILVGTDDGINPVQWTTNVLPFEQFDSAQFGYNTYLAADPLVAGRLYVGSRDVFRVTVNPAGTVSSIENVTVGWAYNSNMGFWDWTPQNSKAHADQQSFAFVGNNSNVFFIGSDGGLNRTENGGATFTTNLNRTLGLTQSIGVTLHPVNQTMVFTGTQDNGTQRRETGTAWKEFISGDGGNVVVNPLDPTMIFTSYVNGTFFRMTNYGNSPYATINSRFPTGSRILFYPPFTGNRTDATLYAGTQTLAVCQNCANSAGLGAWTFPAGSAATDLTRGGSDALSAVAVERGAYSNTQVIYVGSSQGAFRVSQNGGQTFTDRTNVLDNAVHDGNPPATGRGRYITNIRIDPANPATAYLTVSGFGTRHVFKSENFGANISPLNFTVDIPVNDFLISPLSANTFLIATDIGVFRSTDGGASWNQFNNGLPPAIVTAFDASGDGRVVASTYGRGVWQINLTAQTQKTPFDYDGDSKTDVSVFRPSAGSWYVSRSSNNSLYGANFGQAGDLIAPADFDGDARTDVSVFREGFWYRLNSSTNSFASAQFGAAGDLPVPGDFDGDSKADISVFRPSNGFWYRLNSSNNQFIGVNFGISGDKPLVADFDGDGKSDISVFRPSNGGWYRLNSSNGSFFGTNFGVSEDIPTAADFDGDGKADIGVFRPSSGTWYRLNSSNNQFVGQQFGVSEDKPVAGDYDGDGRADIAVFRPSSGIWYLLRSTQGFTAQQWGAAGDLPTPAAFGR